MLRTICNSVHCPAFAGVERRATASASRRAITAAPQQGNQCFGAPLRHAGGRAGSAAGGIENDGDFGARDPYVGEIVTGFGNTPLGNADTMHNVKPPDGMGKFVGLKSKRCAPCEGGNVPKLSQAEAEALRIQVNWRLITTAAGQSAIRHEYKLRNFQAALDMFSRVAALAEAEGHHPDLHLTGYNSVAIELSTHSVGGLTLNDFILAAKINDIDFADLMPKKKAKFWA
jgi:4a-hydroxytetrahydrobiopterin dehydratase